MDHQNKQFLLCCFRVAVGALFALALRGDTVELRTGDRLDGTFRQAGAAGVVIETAGQAITIPLEKVRAIYLGATAARPTTGPSLVEDAMDALKALRSVTQSGITFRDYAPRVLDARVKVDRYLSSVGDAPTATAVRLAMEAYELATQAFPGLERTSIGENLDPNLLEKCPVIKKVVDIVKSLPAWRELGLGDKSADVVDGRPANVALWACARSQFAEAERLLAQH
jgi:hypothetical protein